MDLGAFEPYLRGLAHILIEPGLRAYIEVSDLVQKTFQEGVRSRAQFRGTTAGEMAAWLRQILVHTLQDEVRKLRRGMRDIGRNASFGTTSRRLDVWAAEQTTPSGRASRIEEADRLAQAMARLPEEQRLAVELHHLQEYSVQETAVRMGKSAASVSSLIHRGVNTLYRDLNGNERP